MERSGPDVLFIPVEGHTIPLQIVLKATAGDGNKNQNSKTEYQVFFKTSFMASKKSHAYV